MFTRRSHIVLAVLVLFLSGVGLAMKTVAAAPAPCADSDSDGLCDNDEATYGTDPNDSDTDGDKLLDGYEVFTSHTSPTRADTDGDGLGDRIEVAGLLGYPTDPNKADTDGDGLSDSREIYGTKVYPYVATNATRIDTDADGLNDSAEIQVYFTNPALADSDGDNLTDGAEIKLGTQPLQNDTDGDGVTDGDEVRIFHSDPLNVDTDVDGLRDGDEVARGTNLTNNDTDRDLSLDGVEVNGYPYLEGGQPFQLQGNGLFVTMNRTGNANYDIIRLGGNGIDEIRLGGHGGPIRYGEQMQVNPLDVVDFATGHFRLQGGSYSDYQKWTFLNATNSSDTSYIRIGAQVRVQAYVSGEISPSPNGSLVPYNASLGTWTLVLKRPNEWRSDPLVVDTDKDGLADGWERATKTRPQNPDSDGDGVPDGAEWLGTFGFKSDPNSRDTDRDGLTDAYEIYGKNVYPYYQSNPALWDSDGDGLFDSQELRQFHTNPLSADTDGDGLTDPREISLGTSPLVVDSDGDSIPDGVEVSTGTDPLSATPPTLQSLPVTLGPQLQSGAGIYLRTRDGAFLNADRAGGSLMSNIFAPNFLQKITIAKADGSPLRFGDDVTLGFSASGNFVCITCKQDETLSTDTRSASVFTIVGPDAQGTGAVRENASIRLQLKGTNLYVTPSPGGLARLRSDLMPYATLQALSQPAAFVNAAAGPMRYGATSLLTSEGKYVSISAPQLVPYIRLPEESEGGSILGCMFKNAFTTTVLLTDPFGKPDCETTTVNPNFYDEQPVFADSSSSSGEARLEVAQVDSNGLGLRASREIDYGDSIQLRWANHKFFQIDDPLYWGYFNLSANNWTLRMWQDSFCDVKAAYAGGAGCGPSPPLAGHLQAGVHEYTPGMTLRAPPKAAQGAAYDWPTPSMTPLFIVDPSNMQNRGPVLENAPFLVCALTVDCSKGYVTLGYGETFANQATGADRLVNLVRVAPRLHLRVQTGTPDARAIMYFVAPTTARLSAQNATFAYANNERGIIWALDRNSNNERLGVDAPDWSQPGSPVTFRQFDSVATDPYRIDVVGVTLGGSVWWTYEKNGVAPKGTSWTALPTLPGGVAAKQVSIATIADNRFEIWAVSAQDQIFRRGDDANAAWTQVPGSLSQVDVAGTWDTGRIDVVGVNANGEIYYNQVHAGNAYVPDWIHLPGAAKWVSVAAPVQKLEIWAVNSAGDIFRRTDFNPNADWQQVPGKLVMVDLAARNDGQVHAIGVTPQNKIVQSHIDGGVVASWSWV